MRVLYIAGWSSPQNLSTDSTLTWARGYLLPWVRARKDVFLFMTAPGGDYRATSEKALAEFIAEPRIQLVWTVGDSSKQYREMTAFQPELLRFDELFGEYPWIDVVITDRPAVLPALQCATESYTRMGGWPRVYAVANQFLMDEVSTSWVLPAIRQAQSYGWASAHLTLWSGTDHRDRGLREARQWLSAERIARIQQGCRTYLGGLALDRVAQHARPLSERPAENPIVVWGTAMNQAYFPSEILGEYDKLYSTGHRLRVRVITATKLAEDNQKIRQMIPERYLTWLEWYAALHQEDFWKLASEGSVFVAGALKSEFSYGWAELAMLGLVGIYQDRPEIRATVVPGYPYWWKAKTDIQGWLRHLVLEGAWREPEAQGWVEAQRKFLVEQFTGDSNWPRFDADLRLLEEKRGQPKDAITDLIRQATKDAGAEMTLAQFSRRLKSYSYFERGLDNLNPGRYALCRSVFRGVLLREGWIDVCDQEEPRFVRVAK